MMLPQNNIVPFSLEYLHDKDILLIEKIQEVAGALQYLEYKYEGPCKDVRKITVLKDFWRWCIKEYLKYLE